MKENNEGMKKEIEVIKRDFKGKLEMNPNKEKLLEEVVMELEKVNQALRLCKEERDELRKKIGYVRLN